MPGKTPAEKPKVESVKPKRDPKSFAYRVRGWWEASDAWEVWYLAAMPLVATAGVYQASLGVPLKLRGFVYIFVAYYVGSFFLVLLMLDRRSDLERRMRDLGARRQREGEIAERRVAQQEREAVRERSAAAVRRGREKAAGRTVDE